MSEWKKVKIGDFLTEREGRYKPDDSKISKYKRLDKIDFSGTIHISDKPTKTDMIIVHPDDLVISGINVAKGAVAVYQGDEPVCATIHYSSYTFDSSKVDLDYFKYFVKSPAFIAALQKQVKGGIKTEIKPKHLLPLEISIPDLLTQQRIVKKISLQLQKTEQLSLEIESQKNYIKQLRQNILQDAIEGKLTADWRKQNPLQKGNPDYDAEALFEQIQKERSNEKKQKELSPITDEEKPFEIPEGWKWIKMGEIYSFSNGTASRGSLNGKPYPVLRLADLSSGEIDISNVRCITLTENEFNSHMVCNDDLIFIRVNGSKDRVGTAFLYNSSIPMSYCDHLFCGHKKSSSILSTFTMIVFNCPFSKNQIIPLVKTTTGQNTINQGSMAIIKLPFPPLAEQKEILKQVEKHLQTVSDLENQITEREQLTKTLMQSILKDAFEER